MMTAKRRMTNLEKKQAKQIKKAKQETKSLRKKKSTTMDWIDIDEVKEDRILLKKDKKTATVMGVKLKAHDIFLDEPFEQERWINQLRICHNRLPFKLYFGFVYSQVNVDKQLNMLTEQDRIETDEVCKLMISDDFDKFYDFKRVFRELEFFVMIKCADNKELEKRMTALFSEFQRAGFEPEVLNKYDYYNYISYVFENIHITDYYFARGVYSFENVDYVYDEQIDKYKVINRTEDFSQYTDPVPFPLPKKAEIEKSKLAPTCFKENIDHYILGEKYVCNMLIRKMPEEMDVGILSQFLNDPKIKMFMTTEPLKISSAAALRREYNEKEQLLRKTKDPTLRERIYTQMRSMEVHIKQSQRDNDLTQNIVIVFSIYADSEKELSEIKANLKEILTVQGISIETIPLMQEVLLRLTCPLFFEADIEKTVVDDYGIPGASRAVASMWPYIFETLKDERGMLLGWEMSNKGIVSFDPYYYLHEEAASKLNNRTSGNIITVGKTGMGKSTVMNLIIRDQIKKKTRIVWIDPENQCQAMVLRYGGTYVAWGQKGNIINIFDLKKVTTDDDVPDSDMWDTQLAIVNVINDLTQILSILFPKIDDDVLNVVSDVVYMTYAMVGIKPDSDGVYPSFQGLDYQDMPTFTEFAACIEKRMQAIKGDPSARKEMLLLEDLGLKVRRIRNEWGHYFDGKTTIKFKNPERQIIAFGSKNLINGDPALRAALNHMMFHFSWDLCLDPSNESMFVIDEAHIMILEKGAAELVSQFYRRARKYHCIMMVGTQNPRDFADPSVLTYGKAIFDNAVYKFLMGLDKDSAIDISKLVSLNESELQLIMTLRQSESVFVCGDRRIPIKVWATEQELTDIGSKSL